MAKAAVIVMVKRSFGIMQVSFNPSCLIACWLVVPAHHRTGSIQEDQQGQGLQECHVFQMALGDLFHPLGLGCPFLAGLTLRACLWVPWDLALPFQACPGLQGRLCLPWALLGPCCQGDLANQGNPSGPVHPGCLGHQLDLWLPCSQACLCIPFLACLVVLANQQSTLTVDLLALLHIFLSSHPLNILCPVCPLCPAFPAFPTDPAAPSVLVLPARRECPTFPLLRRGPGLPKLPSLPADPAGRENPSCRACPGFRLRWKWAGESSPCLLGGQGGREALATRACPPAQGGPCRPQCLAFQ